MRLPRLCLTKYDEHYEYDSLISRFTQRSIP